MKKNEKGPILASPAEENLPRQDKDPIKQPQGPELKHRSPRRGSADQSDPSNSTDFVFGGSMTETPPGRRGRAKSHRGGDGWA